MKMVKLMVEDKREECNMKKLTKMLIIPCATLTIVAAGGAIVSFADSTEMVSAQSSVASASDAWKFQIEGDEITITDYIGTDQDVVIPDEIGGKTVVKLNGGIFSGKAITSVVIPDTVTEIGRSLFMGCKQLEDVELSNQIKEILGSTFEDCSNLKEITLPESLEYFDTSAFTDTGITELFIPRNVKTIEVGNIYNAMPAIENYEVDSDNPYFTSVDGMVLNKEENELYLYPNGRIEEYDYIELPESIEIIKSMAELRPKKRCYNYYFYFGNNIKTIEGELESIPVWADPNSTVYKRLKIENFANLYPATKNDFEQMKSVDFWFKYNEDNGLTAYNYLGNDDVMNIPNMVGNLKVTQIYTGLVNADVTTIVIPEHFKNFKSEPGSMNYVWGLNDNKKLCKVINNSEYDILTGAYFENYIGWAKEEDNAEVLKKIPAKSTVLKQYEIEYNSRYIDITDLPDHYAANTEVVLPTPKVRDGYTFKRWYILSDREREYITKIEAGTNKAMQIYAECEKNSSSGGNSGNSGSSSGSHHYSSSSSDSSDSGEPATSNKKNTSSAPVGLQITKSPFIMNSWEKVGNNWKFRMSDGSYAASQWICSNGKWYLIGKDGIMLTGWQLVNSKWYFMNQDGALLTGWQFVNGKWYYLTADGSMLASTQTPDGYKVGADGAWIQ